MTMTIHPHRGVDAIAFGMTRPEVARACGAEAVRGRRSRFDTSDYDFFRTLGVFVYYDRNDTCHAVEFTRDASVSCDGYHLFGHPACDTRSWALARDPDLDARDGFVSKVLGLSMHAPWIDDDELDEDEMAQPAESFLAFRSDYYDEVPAKLAR